MNRRGRLPLLLACLSCGGRAPRAAGADLSRLPRAGDGPLAALLPGPYRFAAAFRDARASWLALRDSALAEALERSGLADGLPALPLVERWEALRARLGQLAHVPLPPLADLLDGPALLAELEKTGPATPEEEGDAGQPEWIWIERLGPAALPALAFARALNAVRPSGSEVEIEQRGGVSLRRVRLGPTLELTYFVIADRLVVATDRALADRSLDLALGRDRHGPAVPLDLEAEARANGFAARWHPEPGSRPPLPGVRWWHAAGRELTAELDGTVWGRPAVRAGTLPGELVRLSAAGLSLPRAWAAVRPAPDPAPEAAPELAVLDDLDALARTLGRGAFLSITRAPGGDPSFRLVLATAEDPTDALQKLLDDALEKPPEGEPEELPGGGTLLCPWGASGPTCVAVCPGQISLAKRARLLERGCLALPAAATAAPVAELRIEDPSGASLLRGELGVEGRGHWL
ncbi:MAG: hypothetical protein ACYDCL_17350 [Myxococcales bacterium]